MQIFSTTLIFLFLLTALTLAIPLNTEEDDNDDTTGEDEGETEDKTAEEEEPQTSQDKERPVQLQEVDLPTSFYHNETETVYASLTKGPCSNNLKFLPASNKSNEQFGHCACHQEAPRGSVDYVPLVYHQPTDTCYPIFQKGYCKNTTDWLIYTAPNLVECLKNPCFKSTLNPAKVVWFGGGSYCVERGALCDPDNPTHVVTFAPFDPVPICAEPVPQNSTIVGVHRNGAGLECRAGHRLLKNGDCLLIDLVN